MLGPFGAAVAPPPPTLHPAGARSGWQPQTGVAWGTLAPPLVGHSHITVSRWRCAVLSRAAWRCGSRCRAGSKAVALSLVPSSAQVTPIVAIAPLKSSYGPTTSIFGCWIFGGPPWGLAGAFLSHPVQHHPRPCAVGRTTNLFEPVSALRGVAGRCAPIHLSLPAAAADFPGGLRISSPRPWR